MPVETGRNYLAEDSGQKLMTVDEFLDQFILHTSSAFSDIEDDSQPRKKQKSVITKDTDTESSPVEAITTAAVVGYLAQHRLMDQIPELRHDIEIPDYCALLSPLDESVIEQNTSDDCADEVRINVWLGPSGTESPLHHDPYHNLLGQVCGYKYVRLYAASESERLFPMPGRLSNNSQIDLRRFDYEHDYCDAGSDGGGEAEDAAAGMYRAAQEASYSETVLGPGEMLFIPRGCWHYVLALDAATAAAWRAGAGWGGPVGEAAGYSASVSLWWGPRIAAPQHTVEKDK